jgi:hypothetical protein
MISVKREFALPVTVCKHWCAFSFYGKPLCNTENRYKKALDAAVSLFLPRSSEAFIKEAVGTNGHLTETST